MQNELQQLEARGDRLTHYELLGVSADADGGTIRRAYLAASAASDCSVPWSSAKTSLRK